MIYKYLNTEEFYTEYHLMKLHSILKCSCGIRCADHMSTHYLLVQSGKTASGGCSAGQGSSEPVAPRIITDYIKYKGSNGQDL
jgi:hypothetical protein